MAGRLLFLLLFILSVSACGGSQYEDVVAREQAINNVWHKAKLRGVSFRAIGQEPGWLLEIIDGKEILLVTDYGQSKIHYSYVKPIEDKPQRKTVFSLEKPVKAEILISGEPCEDVMSGENFATTVVISQAGRVLRGCGRALY